MSDESVLDAVLEPVREVLEGDFTLPLRLIPSFTCLSGRFHAKLLGAAKRLATAYSSYVS